MQKASQILLSGKKTKALISYHCNVSFKSQAGYDYFSAAYIESFNAPNIIVWAAPVMITLVIAEWAISSYQNRDLYNGLDTIAAFAVGVGNVIINALLKVFIFALMLICIEFAPMKM